MLFFRFVRDKASPISQSIIVYSIIFFGLPSESCTHNLQLKRLLLYLIELWGDIGALGQICTDTFAGSRPVSSASWDTGA